MLFLLQHLYSCLRTSKKHAREDNPAEKSHFISRSDDVEVEVAHCVYGPVEPSENIVSLASTILEDLQTNLLHLPHQGNVLTTEGSDVHNVFLIMTRVTLSEINNSPIKPTLGITR